MLHTIRTSVLALSKRWSISTALTFDNSFSPAKSNTHKKFRTNPNQTSAFDSIIVGIRNMLAFTNNVAICVCGNGKGM